ncbi:MAG: hypothetical protein GKS00_29210 [Alphaproteobacteria bacterium]|nr:hypothetical protein [Alphaproteobacteria bacterium]
MIDRPGIQGLNGFVFYFTLPLMLFHTMATAPLRENFDGAFVLACLTAAVAVHLTGMAIARWVFKRSLTEQAIQGIACSFGNTVFIALPIATELFGPAAALPMALLITIENGIIMPFTVALIEIERVDRGALWRVPLAALTAILRNPIVMSVLLGATVAMFDIDLPSLLDGLVVLVKGATVPCALFAMGATLAGLPLSERVWETSLLVTLKLFAYPVFMFAAMALLPDVDPVWRSVAVLSAAMPMGANVYLIAARYKTYEARSSTAVLLSTMCSVVTVSFLALALADGPLKW